MGNTSAFAERVLIMINVGYIWYTHTRSMQNQEHEATQGKASSEQPHTCKSVGDSRKSRVHPLVAVLKHCMPFVPRVNKGTHAARSKQSGGPASLAHLPLNFTGPAAQAGSAHLHRIQITYMHSRKGQGPGQGTWQGMQVHVSPLSLRAQEERGQQEKAAISAKFHSSLPPAGRPRILPRLQAPPPPRLMPLHPADEHST
eukprot:scaffold209597_cov18-Tisochrysis_lutea.AAC.1